jgi:hypothetical protein
METLRVSLFVCGNYLKPVHKSGGRYEVRRLVAAFRSAAILDRNSRLLAGSEKRRLVAALQKAPPSLVANKPF